VLKELVRLKSALDARDETKVLVGCVSITTSLARLPKAMVDELEPFCYVEASPVPRQRGPRRPGRRARIRTLVT
jgi:hypothetical protein